MSLDTSARRILESAPIVLPTSLATVSHGVPTVRLAKNSLPRFTASAIAGGTSGRTWETDTQTTLRNVNRIGDYSDLISFSSSLPVAKEAHDLLATSELTCLALN